MINISTVEFVYKDEHSCEDKSLTKTVKRVRSQKDSDKYNHVATVNSRFIFVALIMFIFG